ncbi:MAG: sugar phosphate isomerase/epimerase [Erysipelotrichia bacterium]|nr:sugar phosphate isomerase/epimerase [Erysipelotrichia bacterium]NCC54043.1 sugar phosphate isomerase/epimerase [Erysipelotrichia bacterium]
MLEHNTNYAIISDQIDQDLDTACQKIKAEGYQYVELHNVFNKSIEECNDAEVEQIQNILEKYDLSVVNIASTVFFLCPLYDHYRVSLFNDTFHAIVGDVNEHLAKLHNACKIAKQLNCQIVRIFPFRFPDNEEVGVVGSDEDLTRIKECLKKAVAVAKQYEITLVLENCPYSHCPKGAMTYALIKAVNDEHLKLLWDPANSYRAQIERVPKQYLGLTLQEEYALIKDEIKHVHLKNYTYDASCRKPFIHKALLAGDIAYESLLKQLQNNSYYLSLEPEVSEDEAITSMRQLKRIMAE